MSSSYTAFIDSGIGGVSVLADARRLLPWENFIYFGDVLNAPYGSKTTEEVTLLLKQNIELLADRYLLKAILLACNTATAAAVDQIRQDMAFPILGMEPALKPAVEQTAGQIVVLGTELTLREQKFQALLAATASAREVVLLPCPGLMEIIEEDPQNIMVREYLLTILNPYRQSAQALVLGCTHYVFVLPILKKICPHAQIFNGNIGVCQHLERTLISSNITGGESKTIYISTDGNEQQFAAKCQLYYDYYLNIT